MDGDSARSCYEGPGGKKQQDPGKKETTEPTKEKHPLHTPGGEYFQESRLALPSYLPNFPYLLLSSLIPFSPHPRRLFLMHDRGAAVKKPWLATARGHAPKRTKKGNKRKKKKKKRKKTPQGSLYLGKMSRNIKASPKDTICAWFWIAPSAACACPDPEARHCTRRDPRGGAGPSRRRKGSSISCGIMMCAAHAHALLWGVSLLLISIASRRRPCRADSESR